MNSQIASLISKALKLKNWAALSSDNASDFKSLTGEVTLKNILNRNLRHRKWLYQKNVMICNHIEGYQLYRDNVSGGN